MRKSAQPQPKAGPVTVACQARPAAIEKTPTPAAVSPLRAGMDKLLLACRNSKSSEDLLAELARVDKDPNGLGPMLATIFGVDGPNLAFSLFSHSICCGGGHEELSAFIEAVFGLRPANANEALLVSQMLAVHSCAMRALASASTAKFVEDADRLTNRAVKLMGLFSRQCELLARLKGTLSQQKITIERIDLKDNAQAAIGVASRGGVGGRK